MKTQRQLLKGFYNEKINHDNVLRPFHQLSEDEIKGMQNSHSFAWYELLQNWKELTKSFQFSVAITYLFAFSWFGFCFYLLYLGFKVFFKI